MNKLIKKIQHQYGYGDCAIFALAMARFYNLSIVSFHDKEDLFHVALLIPGKNLKEDKFLDVFGINSFQDIKRRYNIIGKIMVEIESDLNKLKLFSNVTIEQAQKDFDYLIKMNVLHKDYNLL